MIQQYSAACITAQETLDNLQKEYQIKFDAARAAVDKARHELALATSVYRDDKILAAFECVYFIGMKHYGKGDTCEIVDRLIKDLIKDPTCIDKQYYYCKNYAQFQLQSGTSRYGMGPSHGHVVFEIGRRDGDAALTPIQVDSILYVLYNLPDPAFVELVFNGK